MASRADQARESQTAGKKPAHVGGEQHSDGNPRRPDDMFQQLEPDNLVDQGGASTGREQQQEGNKKRHEGCIITRLWYFRGMNRRDFLASTAAIPVLGLSQTPNMTQTLESHSGAISLGIATYTFRNFSRAYTIKAIKDMGIVDCNVKDMHLPMNDTPEQLRAGVK